MTAPSSSLHTEYFRDLPKRPAFYMPLKALLKWGALIVVALLILGIWLANLLISARYDIIRSEVEQRLEIISEGRANVFNTWLDGLTNIGNHITQADIIRLFSTEMKIVEGMDNGDKLQSSLVEQLPYMQKVMADYADQHNLATAVVVGQNGKPYLAAGQTPQLTDDQLQGVQRVFTTGQPEVLPMRAAGGALLADVLKPIQMLEEEDRNPQVVAVLVSVFPVRDTVADLLAPGRMAQPGERTHLLQRNNDDIEKIMVGVPSDTDNQPTVAVWGLEPTFLEKANQPGPVTPMNSPVDDRSVFLDVTNVPGQPFMVLQEYIADNALAPLAAYRSTVYSMITISLLFVGAVILLLAMYFISTRNRQRVHVQEQILEALVKAIEIRDPYVAGHHERVARLAIEIGNRMRLPVGERSTLYYAALMSGIGKIFVPKELLTKAGKLTPKEKKELQSHIDHAMNVISTMEFDYPIAPVIHQMYERMDGTGYPNAINGNEINLLSRILGACDVFCAMTEPRAYRKGMTSPKALEELQEEENKFDKGVISVLEDVVKERVAAAKKASSKKG